jgi:hypothetical protein
MALTEQLAEFPERERFAQAVLGLLALADRIAQTLELTRADGGRSPDGPLSDVILGAVSVRRTLRAVIATGGELSAPPQAPPLDPAAPREAARWLR